MLAQCGNLFSCRKVCFKRERISVFRWPREKIQSLIHSEWKNEKRGLIIGIGIIKRDENHDKPSAINFLTLTDLFLVRYKLSVRLRNIYSNSHQIQWGALNVPKVVFRLQRVFRKTRHNLIGHYFSSRLYRNEPDLTQNPYFQKFNKF